MNADWANVMIAGAGLFLTIVTFLLNAIRIVLNDLRTDIRIIAEKENILTTRMIIVEEKMRHLKCQECKIKEQ